MKTYTINQVYFKYMELKTKAFVKKSWNREATSYEINLKRIRQASHQTLLNSPTLNDSDKAMLLIMSSEKS